MSVIINTPQVHLIGDIKLAQGFKQDRLFCRYTLKVGHNWSLLSGKDSGETYEEIKESTDPEAGVYWDHPFDVHYKAKTMRGWPKLFLEVWQVDEHGRYTTSGYGIATLPFSPGQHTVEVKCWRPKTNGWLKQLGHRLLGIQQEVEFKDMVMSSQDRFGFETESTGTVFVDVGIIVKDFNLHGVQLFTQI